MRLAFLRLLLRGGLLVLGRIDLVRSEQLLVLFRVLQQLFQYFHNLVRTLCRDTVEAEAFRLLALAVEVGEEVVQHIAMTVETQEILRVLRFGGFQGSASRRVSIPRPRRSHPSSRL